MENQRVRLSKKLLKNSLVELLQANDIGKIKINTICENAQINRTTFYKYYGNQYDLLKEIENDFFKGIEENIPDRRNDKSNYELSKLLEYLENNRQICLTLINARSSHDFAEKLFGLEKLSFMDEVCRAASDEKHWKYLKTFVFEGCYAVLIEWLSSEKRESPKEVTDALYEIMSVIFTHND